ncbi:MAG: hypothetical protein AAGD43_36170, partial [Pseudomonadota bacterium]
MTVKQDAFFNLHHIYAQEVFDNEEVKALAEDVFGDDGLPLDRNMAGNLMLAPNSEAAHAMLRAAVNNGNTTFRDMNVAASQHGSHGYYNTFQVQQTRLILQEAKDALVGVNDPAVEAAIKARAENQIFDLIFFSQDQALDGKISLATQGDSAAQLDALSDAWDNHRGGVDGVITDAQLNAYYAQDPAITQSGFADRKAGFDTTVMEAGVVQGNPNAHGRHDAFKAGYQAIIANQELPQELRDRAQSELDRINDPDHNVTGGAGTDAYKFITLLMDVGTAIGARLPSAQSVIAVGSFVAGAGVLDGLSVSTALAADLTTLVPGLNGVTAFNLTSGLVNTAQSVTGSLSFDAAMSAQVFTGAIGLVAGQQALHSSNFPGVTNQAQAKAFGDSFSQAFTDAIKSIPASTVGNALVGIGGGVFGDAAEFANTAYDSFKKGLDTGDWSDFHGDIAQFGLSVLLSAVMIGGSIALATALAPLVGLPLGAIVAAAWAAYGIIDGMKNIIELLGKIYEDRAYWLDQIDPALSLALEAAFGIAFSDPLIIDMDGDFIELLSVDQSQALFEIDNDGFKENPGWVSPDDAFLAIDK